MRHSKRRRMLMCPEMLERRLALSTVTPFSTSVVVDGQDAVPFAGQDSAFLSSLVDGDPELKGNSVASYFGDLSNPDVIPTAVSLDNFGSKISIGATGFWSHTPTPDSGPQGKCFVLGPTEPQYTVFGISAIETYLNTLVGVFLSDDGPDPDNIPGILSIGDDMTNPELGQTFAIGSALNNIMVPNGATVLYLGLNDFFGWTGNSGTVEATITEVALPIDVDIKPGTDTNSINLDSNGTVPVAIISSEVFDATTVDPSTVTLADANVRINGGGNAMASAEDVNNDDILDLVVHVETSQLSITDTAISADLTGRTFGGELIKGADSVNIVPHSSPLFSATVVVDGQDAVPFAGQDSAFLSSLVDGDPELKGNSVASYFGDLSDPEVIPTAVSLADFGSEISISAAGFWSHTPTPDSGPQGKCFFGPTLLQYTVFGISAIETDLNTLVGVFLSDDGPDPDNVPNTLSMGDDMTNPELGQTFAIGASLDNITVPNGATVLYLGLNDTFGWFNNSETVDVTITG